MSGTKVAAKAPLTTDVNKKCLREDFTKEGFACRLISASVLTFSRLTPPPCSMLLVVHAFATDVTTKKAVRIAVLACIVRYSDEESYRQDGWLGSNVPVRYLHQYLLMEQRIGKLKPQPQQFEARQQCKGSASQSKQVGRRDTM